MFFMPVREKKLIFMKLNELLYEDLEINSSDKQLDRDFKAALAQVFSPQFLSKINRLFNVTLKLKNFKERTNVMCYTVGTSIYVNAPLFKNTPHSKAVNYLLHELIHVLMNTKRFPELNKLQSSLVGIVRAYVEYGKESDFLTGKHQNLHSTWKGEVINYLFNDSINWKISSKIKDAYYKALEESGIFNLSSNFWKKRFDK